MERTYRDEQFIHSFEHGYTWLNGFLRNVRRYGHRPAVIDPVSQRQWSYRQLDGRVNQLANALRRDGVERGDVVMSVMLNCPELVTAYIAPRKIGAIVYLANFNLSALELSLLLDFNKPKVLLYSAEITENIVDALAMAKYRPRRVIMADNLWDEVLPQGHLAYQDYVEDKDTTPPEMGFEPHIYDEVLRLCTSGTTALPKSVPVSDINEVLSAHDIIMHYTMNCNEVSLHMTPWFHRGGCHVGGLCPVLYVGGAVVCMRSFSPKLTLQWTEKYGITFLIGAPSSLEMLCRMQEKNPVDLSSLRGLVTMGAPLERESCIRYMTILSPNLYNGYGTTETMCNTYLFPRDLPEHAGSAGRSCVDDDVRVVCIHEGRRGTPEETVPQDGVSVGEVIIFSPAKSTSAYVRNPELEAEKFDKGWMYTGDLATWDAEGYITLCGRKDDMIICSGENIYPTQIEEVLNGHPKVAECMVTSVPDPIRGEAVTAYVIPADKSLTIRELVDYCNGGNQLSPYKRPRFYRLVDAIPYNATGKKLHNVMKEQALRDFEAGVLRRC